ncbi:hypothetical protein OU5_0306 [Pseudomonas mandelii JR-1]|uniref:Uncharacterized protein n=1 Tax=Pseudomonas mandelii JR-1 TaxID=1147786 RepID=A0A024E489_9PSED|nr:hypothetical protein OU5_0306 [Pseudomonas mandelii JR-1]
MWRSDTQEKITKNPLHSLAETLYLRVFPIAQRIHSYAICALNVAV